MIGVPLVVVWATSQFLYFKLPTLSALVLSLVLSYACAAALSRIWERRSKTAEVSFSELMIWSWYRLHKAERRIENGLQAAETSESHDEQLQVLHELAAALESKDPYTRGHSRRVERHSFKTGVAMGLPFADVEALRMSASLHDVGKIRIPNSVLHKPGRLTEDERDLIEEHPALGAQMVASMDDQLVIEAVLHHHERWDGAGYPEGKAGEEIPLFSRVIAVADSYDAIRSNRSYRRGASRDEAVQVLKDESGHQFDAEVVTAFLTTLPARGRVVAAFTSLGTGPGALWRYLAQLFQRFGSTALAPAIGATGTAVILGTASLLTPGVPAVAAEKGAVSQEASGASASARREAALERERAAEALADSRAAEELRTARRQERRAAERKKREAAQRRERDAAGGSTDGSGTGSGSGTGTGTGTGGSTTDGSGSGAGTGTGGSTTGTDTGTTGGDTGTDGDPNAEGKDCKKGSREQGKGYDMHCG